MNEESNPNALPPGERNTEHQETGKIELPIGEENENPDERETERRKKKRYWKTFRIAAVFGIIEVVSLVVWIKSEDYGADAAHFIRCIAACGFLAGGAYLAHKLTGGKFKNLFIRIIWLAWFLTCLALLIFTPPPSADEVGNPIGLLRPAFGPVPDVIKSSSALWPEKATFLIFGGNVVAVPGNNSTIPAITFNEVNFLKIGISENKAFVSVYIFGTNGQMVAMIETNNFMLNRLNFFRKFSNKSSLAIFDEQNVEVLNVRFLRPDVFQISGRIRFPDATEVVITETNVTYKGLQSWGNKSIGIGGLYIRNGGIGWGGFWP